MTMPYYASSDLVQVIQLHTPDRPYESRYDGEQTCRPPQVGDLGMILNEEGREIFRVAAVSCEMGSAWEALFHCSEIERLYRTPIDWDQLPKTAFEITRRLRIGMTKQDVIDALGEPHDVGGTSRKYRTPSIFKYDGVELYFKEWKTGTLLRVYMENELGIGFILLD